MVHIIIIETLSPQAELGLSSYIQDSLVVSTEDKLRAFGYHTEVDVRVGIAANFGIKTNLGADNGGSIAARTS